MTITNCPLARAVLLSLTCVGLLAACDANRDTSVTDTTSSTTMTSGANDLAASEPLNNTGAVPPGPASENTVSETRTGNVSGTATGVDHAKDKRSRATTRTGVSMNDANDEARGTASDDLATVEDGSDEVAGVDDEYIATTDDTFSSTTSDDMPMADETLSEELESGTVSETTTAEPESAPTIAAQEITVTSPFYHERYSRSAEQRFMDALYKPTGL